MKGMEREKKGGESDTLHNCGTGGNQSKGSKDSRKENLTA